MDERNAGFINRHDKKEDMDRHRKNNWMMEQMLGLASPSCWITTVFHMPCLGSHVWTDNTVTIEFIIQQNLCIQGILQFTAHSQTRHRKKQKHTHLHNLSSKRCILIYNKNLIYKALLNFTVWRFHLKVIIRPNRKCQILMVLNIGRIEAWSQGDRKSTVHCFSLLSLKNSNKFLILSKNWGYLCIICLLCRLT